MVEVYPVEAPQYLDAAGNLREAVGVRVVPDATYLDAEGNVRGAIGVNIVGGGGGGDGANVNNGDIVLVDPGSSAFTDLQAIARVDGSNLVSVDLDGTYGFLKNATATTGVTLNGTVRALTPTVADGAITNIQTPATTALLASSATVPVQNSAGASIAAGTVTVAANAVTHVRLPATVAAVANSGIIQIKNAATGAISYPAVASVANGIITTANIGASAVIIDNVSTFTATGGETVFVEVAAGVPSFTVRSDPFWDPFTLTAGVDANGRGYDPAEGLGSITNQPVDGATVTSIFTPEGNDLEIRMSSTTVPLNNITRASQIGIGATTYSPTDVRFQQGPEGSTLYIYIAAGSFAWTDGQQVPIVIIP